MEEWTIGRDTLVSIWHPATKEIILYDVEKIKMRKHPMLLYQLTKVTTLYLLNAIWISSYSDLKSGYNHKKNSLVLRSVLGKFILIQMVQRLTSRIKTHCYLLQIFK